MALVRKDYFTVFDALTGNPHITIPILRGKLPGPPDTKTVTRVRNITERLLNYGAEAPTPEEAQKIAQDNSTYGATIKSVYGIYDHLCAWRTNQLKKEVLLKEHWDKLFKVAEEIRSCLEHPTLNYLPDRGLLTFGDYDWRLDPVTWFFLSTPDIGSPDWGSELKIFKSHTIASPFWGHLDELKQATQALEKEYDEMANKLSNDDEKFKELWLMIRRKRAGWDDDWTSRPSRTPVYPEPSLKQIETYFDQECADEVMSKFFKIATGNLALRQLHLEEMLDQLYEDLLPDEINPYIVKGHCEKCP